MEKCPAPNLPTIKLILEDISDPAIITEEYPKRLLLDDEQLDSAYSCFFNLKKLNEDINKQSKLNCELEELNKKLIENIASLKAQASRGMNKA